MQIPWGTKRKGESHSVEVFSFQYTSVQLGPIIMPLISGGVLISLIYGLYCEYPTDIYFIAHT